MVAVAGTFAVIAVAEFTVKLPLTPLNVTAVVPVKLVPLIVTLVPAGPLVGVKVVIVGGGGGVDGLVIGLGIAPVRVLAFVR